MDYNFPFIYDQSQRLLVNFTVAVCCRFGLFNDFIEYEWNTYEKIKNFRI